MPCVHRWSRVATCVVMLSACSGPQGHPGRQATEPATIEVVTAPAVLHSLGTDIEAVGTARANESAVVTSKVASIVSAIRFREGEHVRRGAVLIELENHAQRAAVREAEASLAQSASQLERGKALRREQILSAAQLELLEAAAAQDHARLDAARARLADTVIRAGFDGEAGFRRVSVGSLVAPGDAITTLDDISRIKLEFTVPEGGFHLLKLGIEITATTPGLPGRTFTGAVTALEPRIDVATRSITVRAEIPNAGREIRPGMFMHVIVHTEPAPALLVPEETLMPEQGNTFVLVVEDGEVKRRAVKTGRRRPGEVEIVSGLAADERVIARGLQNVRVGSRVREVPADAVVP